MPITPTVTSPARPKADRRSLSLTRFRDHLVEGDAWRASSEQAKRILGIGERPPWPVQRAAFVLLAPIARLRGHAAA
jgi:hypothetical protein